MIPIYINFLKLPIQGWYLCKINCSPGPYYNWIVYTAWTRLAIPFQMIFVGWKTLVRTTYKRQKQHLWAFYFFVFFNLRSFLIAVARGTSSWWAFGANDGKIWAILLWFNDIIGFIGCHGKYGRNFKYNKKESGLAWCRWQELKDNMVTICRFEHTLTNKHMIQASNYCCTHGSTTIW